MPRYAEPEYEPMVNLATKIPWKLHRKLRLLCETRRLHLREGVIEALEGWIKKVEAR